MGSEARKILVFAVSLLALWLGVRYLMPVALPFALGAGMALAAEPGVRFLCSRLRLPRGLAAGITVSGVFVIICVLITMALTLLFRELGLLAGVLPEMEQTVMDGLESLRGWAIGLSEQASPGIQSLIQRNVADIFSNGAALLDKATRYALGLAGTLLSHLPDSALGLGTAVLSAFLISAELPRIRQWAEAHISGKPFQPALTFLRKLRATAGLWLLAQAKLSGITCLMLTAGFLLLRISYAPLWAVVISVLDALPVLGTGSVLVPWSLILFLRGDTPRAIGLLGIYIATALIRSMLEPKLVGRQLGLDPLVTLIALYAGFRFWGLPGMILAPLLAITVIRMLPEAKKREE